MALLALIAVGLAGAVVWWAPAVVAIVSLVICAATVALATSRVEPGRGALKPIAAMVAAILVLGSGYTAWVLLHSTDSAARWLGDGFPQHAGAALYAVAATRGNFDNANTALVVVAALVWILAIGLFRRVPVVALAPIVLFDAYPGYLAAAVPPYHLRVAGTYPNLGVFSVVLLFALMSLRLASAIATDPGRRGLAAAQAGLTVLAGVAALALIGRCVARFGFTPLRSAGVLISAAVLSVAVVRLIELVGRSAPVTPEAPPIAA